MKFKIPRRRADHHLFVDVAGVNGRTYEQVDCKLYLPSKGGERPLFFLVPPREPFRLGMYNDFWKFSLVGTEDDSWPKLVISSDTVLLRSTGEKEWSAGESVWMGVPLDLKIQFFHEGGTKSKCAFWITPNYFLTPAYGIERNLAGTRRIKQFNGSKRSFKLKNGLRLSFKTHYKYQSHNKGRNEIPQLVAEADISRLGGIGGISADVLSDIDDFLLISGLALRQTCICTGWEGFDPSGNATYYRGDKIAPKKLKANIINGLIHYRHHLLFLKTIYPRFVESSSVGLIRQVIHSLLVNQGTLEDTSLRLFAALETLVLAYRRENGLEFIFDNEEERNHWRAIKNDKLKAWIRQQPLFKGERNKAKRVLIYDNLSGLERVPFSHAFKAFCQDYTVPLADLWPIAGGARSLWSLTMIRNKLAHGDNLGSHKTEALGTSIQHLRWTVERMLLAYLGWDVEKSAVSQKSLGKHYPNYREWATIQRQISV